MAGFAEYAALARQLSDLHRSGAQANARLAEQRGGAEAVADRLEQRLAAQYHRLDSLAASIGKQIPPPSSSSAGTAVAGFPEGVAPPPPAGGGAPVVRHLPPPRFGQQGSPPAAPAGGTDGHGSPGGRAAGAPYPEVGGGPARRALPSVSGADTGGFVPGQRGPADPAAGVMSSAGMGSAAGAVSSAWSADPHRELELAQRAADGADVILVQAETMAEQAPLLPTLSPVRRAFAVYGVCATALAITIWIILTVVEVREATSSFSKAANAFGVFAWSCAGLPAIAFFAGYLVLNIWGKPRGAAGRPAALGRLGFLICFLASPVAFLAYYLVT